MATIAQLRDAGWTCTRSGPTGYFWLLTNPHGLYFEIDRGEGHTWIVDAIGVRDEWSATRLCDALDTLLTDFTHRTKEESA